MADTQQTSEADAAAAAEAAAAAAEQAALQEAVSTTTAQGCSESRISTHTCNSLHPAVAIDVYGHPQTTWHDNRDGNFEIYYKALRRRFQGYGT